MDALRQPRGVFQRVFIALKQALHFGQVAQTLFAVGQGIPPQCINPFAGANGAEDVRQTTAASVMHARACAGDQGQAKMVCKV